MGVRKTYDWKQALKDNAEEATPQKYAYVSLFGIKTVSELRAAILMNSNPLKLLGATLETETHIRDVVQLAKSRLMTLLNRYGNASKNVLYGGIVSVALESFALRFVRDTLVCMTTWNEAQLARMKCSV